MVRHGRARRVYLNLDTNTHSSWYLTICLPTLLFSGGLPFHISPDVRFFLVLAYYLWFAIICDQGAFGPISATSNSSLGVAGRFLFVPSGPSCGLRRCRTEVGT